MGPIGCIETSVRIYHYRLLPAILGSRPGHRYALRVKKGKAVPLPAWSGPEVSRKLRFPDFIVRLSALRTGRLYPQEIHLLLISVRGCVDPRAKVRPEGLCH